MKPGDKVHYILKHHGRNGNGKPPETLMDAVIISVDHNWITARVTNTAGKTAIIKKEHRKFRRT